MRSVTGRMPLASPWRIITVDYRKMASDLGMATEDAHEFLKAMCEPDESGRIVGIMGL
jgi:hypothetical protein